MKKIIFYSLIIIIFLGFFSTKTFAQTPLGVQTSFQCADGTTQQVTCDFNGGLAGAKTPAPALGTCTLPSGQQFSNELLSECTSTGGTFTPLYNFLAPLPCSGSTNTNCTTDAKGNSVMASFDPSNTSALGTYLNLMITLIIGIAAVLAVVMIVIGGMQYMTSELISSKEEGKERIEHALLGLLIALGSFALLNTINPNLLNTNFNSLTAAQVNVLANDNTPQTPITVNGVSSYTTGGTTYAAGSNFAQDFPNSSLATLPNGVTIYNQQCTTVGQSNCTSTLGLNTSMVSAIENDCTSQNNGTPCQISITGGTEFWLHNDGTGHTPGSSDVDIAATSTINSYIDGNGSNAFPTGSTVQDPNTKTCYYAEGAGATAATTGNHWHVYPMSASGQC